MNTLPVFYHPTTILILDDDENFLDALSDCVNVDGKVMTFHTADAMKNFLENYEPFYKNKKFINSLTKDEDYENIHHAPAILDLTLLSKIHLDPNRKSEVSTLIIDYKMPTINGLDFSKDYTYSDFKKILLTGESIEDKIIEGFNKKLIDRYLQKGSSNLVDYLNKNINNLIEQYFIEISAPIRAYLEADKNLPISDVVFIDYFKKICRENGVTEYYLIDKNGSYLCIDKNNNAMILAVHTDVSLDRWVQMNQEISNHLLASIRERKNIPFFGIEKESWQISEDQWSRYFYASTVLNGKEKYYVALIKQ